MRKTPDTGLCLAITAGFLCPVPLTFAQNPSPAPQTTGLPGVTVEEVIVTGSTSPTSEEDFPNQVIILNRDLINKSGQGITTEQLLKSQPVMMRRLMATVKGTHSGVQNTDTLTTAPGFDSLLPPSSVAGP